MKNKYTTGDIARLSGLHRQTVHTRILILRLDPITKIGRTRLYSIAQAKKIMAMSKVEA